MENTIKYLLENAINNKNMFMTDDLIRLQIEFFHTAGKLDDTEKAELLGMLPVEAVAE